MIDRTAINAGFATLREALPAIQQAIHDELHTDTYTCWTVNRPAGWADSTSVEALGVVESGTGKLRANGVGGPQTGEMVVSLESPFVFRTEAWRPHPDVPELRMETDIQPGNLLVINDTRLFRVDTPKPEYGDDRLISIGVTELFQTPMPEVP